MEVYLYRNMEDSVNGPVKRLIAYGEKRINFSIAAHKNMHVYITGGNMEGYITYTAVCFSLATHTLSIIKPMDHHRQSHGSITIADNLYVIGGYDGSIYLDSIEVLNLTKRWYTWETLITPSFTSRSDALVTKLNSNQLLICGGRVGNIRLPDVFLFD